MKISFGDLYNSGTIARNDQSHLQWHPIKYLDQFFKFTKKYCDHENNPSLYNIPYITNILKDLKYSSNKKNVSKMQYFVALKIGEKRVKQAQDLLKHYTGNAMPALSLKDVISNDWYPVGEENLFAVVKTSNGYMIVLCDSNGIAKTIAQWFSEEDKNNIILKIKEEQNLQEYFGKLSLPI